MARARGCAGVVVDGAARDLDELGRLGVPVFGRSVVPVSARGRYVEVETDGAVEVSGVRVAPGDLLLADGSGVVRVEPERAAEVLDVAERLAAREDEMARRLEAGGSPSRILGEAYERLTARDG